MKMNRNVKEEFLLINLLLRTLTLIHDYNYKSMYIRSDCV